VNKHFINKRNQALLRHNTVFSQLLQL